MRATPESVRDMMPNWRNRPTCERASVSEQQLDNYLRRHDLDDAEAEERSLCRYMERRCAGLFPTEEED